MYKLTLVTVLATVASLAAAQPLEHQETCSSDAVEYLRAIKVDPSIKVLTDEMDRHYPRLGELIERMPSRGFINTMTAIGPQQGCDHLVEHISQLDMMVPCFSERFDAEGLIDLVNNEPSVKPAVESYYACLASVSFASDELSD